MFPRINTHSIRREEWRSFRLDLSNDILISKEESVTKYRATKSFLSFFLRRNIGLIFETFRFKE